MEKNMRKLLVMTFLLSTQAQAIEMNMKPGLWEISMKMMVNGKEFDPLAEMKKSLANLPEEQRKQILAGISKAGGQSNISQVCYTKEMMKEPSSFTSEESKDCDYKITSQTAKKMTATFNCKDGNSGTSVWDFTSSTQMHMRTEAKDKKGKKTDMIYSGKFIKADCGKGK